MIHAYSLYDKVLAEPIRQAGKHGLADDGNAEGWALGYINAMSNVELLEKLSFALHELLEEEGIQ